MSFLTLGALSILLFVAAPIAAHMLRKRQAEERPFPPAHLVPATPPEARRRSLLEDRALFAVRALAVVGLALLGATPFVHCSRLSIARRSGASVALAFVIDDSLSMRAALPSGTTRWARALAATSELARGLGPGDAAAIVLAGSPPRVVLGSTSNIHAVSEAIDKLTPSDRATDLDLAVRLGKSLLKNLPQQDKRVVLLSDLADGSPEGVAPLRGDADIAIWEPVPELAARGADCAITRADRSGPRVWARVVCTPNRATPTTAPSATSAVASAMAPEEGPSVGRSLEIKAGSRVLGSVKLGPSLLREEVAVDVPANAPEILLAALTGHDAIAEDDVAPVVAVGGTLPMAVVVDATTTHVVTGGPPPVEQAFAALALDAEVRPLPFVPEHDGELNTYAALLVDDAPGFTPEVRHRIAAWVERGGVVLLTLGPRAAAAPLGASFDPLVPGVVRWGESPAKGIDPASGSLFGASVEGLRDLAPTGRASLDPDASSGATVLARWQDGAPLLLRRSMGRGAVLALTLPLSTDESDLVLRPAFLSLLEHFASMARTRGGARRIDVGEAWTFDGYRTVKVQRLPLGGATAGAPASAGKPQPIALDEGLGAPTGTDAERRRRAEAPLAGLYQLDLDGERTLRVAAVPDREINFRLRAVHEEAHAASLGGVDPSLDVSPMVALGLLVLFAAELLLRLVGRGLGPLAPRRELA